jgi:hypothetical protein
LNISKPLKPWTFLGSWIGLPLDFFGMKLALTMFVSTPGISEIEANRLLGMQIL